MNGAFPPFAIARLPRIEFGSSTLEKLPAIAAGYGRHLLLVTGLRSFAESEAGTRLLATCPPELIAADGRDARRFLVDTRRHWEAELALPRLAAYGIGEGDLPRIVAANRGSSMKTNPLVLSDRELTQILSSRL